MDIAFGLAWGVTHSALGPRALSCAALLMRLHDCSVLGPARHFATAMCSWVFSAENDVEGDLLCARCIWDRPSIFYGGAQQSSFCMQRRRVVRFLCARRIRIGAPPQFLQIRAADVRPSCMPTSRLCEQFEPYSDDRPLHKPRIILRGNAASLPFHPRSLADSVTSNRMHTWCAPGEVAFSAVMYRMAARPTHCYAARRADLFSLYRIACHVVNTPARPLVTRPVV
mgnify:CR=1 FL=1